MLDADHCVATWDRAVLSVFRSRVTLQAIEEMHAATRSVGALQPATAPLCFLSVVERTSPPPADDTRRALSEFFRVYEGRMSNVVIVPEGGGFRAAIVRGVGVALSTFAPRSLPFKFAESVGAACRMVAPDLSPDAGGAMTLERIVEDIRRAVAAKADAAE